MYRNQEQKQKQENKNKVVWYKSLYCKLFGHTQGDISCFHSYIFHCSVCGEEGKHKQHGIDGGQIYCAILSSIEKEGKLKKKHKCSSLYCPKKHGF